MLNCKLRPIRVWEMSTLCFSVFEAKFSGKIVNTMTCQLCHVNSGSLQLFLFSYFLISRYGFLCKMMSKCKINRESRNVYTWNFWNNRWIKLSLFKKNLFSVQNRTLITVEIRKHVDWLQFQRLFDSRSENQTFSTQTSNHKP